MIETDNILSTIYSANGFPFEMITVEKGRFIMGDDKSNHKDEKPAHPVTFKHDFEIGKFPVTQTLWEAVMGENTNPSNFKGANRPVENVSWDDIRTGNRKEDKIAFLDKLNSLEEIKKQNAKDGKQFRLPTEAQWEYAARGGKYWADFKYEYAGSNQIKEVAWYRNNSHRETKPVGLKMPNILGIYDMSGNVWEWCEDVWQDSYEEAPEDGTARMKGEKEIIRVVRGGSWVNVSDDCRVAIRYWVDSVSRSYIIGFRLSRY